MARTGESKGGSEDLCSIVSSDKRDPRKKPNQYVSVKHFPSCHVLSATPMQCSQTYFFTPVRLPTNPVPPVPRKHARPRRPRRESSQPNNKPPRRLDPPDPVRARTMHRQTTRLPTTQACGTLRHLATTFALSASTPIPFARGKLKRPTKPDTTAGRDTREYK